MFFYILKIEQQELFLEYTNIKVEIIKSEDFSAQSLKKY